MLLCDFFLFSTSSYAQIDSKIIGGTTAPEQETLRVVAVTPMNQPDPAHCSAVFVGPRVLVFANHCLNHQNTGHIFLRGRLYDIEVVRPQAEPIVHDLAIGITKDPIKEAIPISIGKAEIESNIEALGYGCSVAGTPPDGTLRMTTGKIVSFFSENVFKSNLAHPACGGDSGGAVVAALGPKRFLVGVISGGSGYQLYATRLDSVDSTELMKLAVAKYQVNVCGLNIDCP